VYDNLSKDSLTLHVDIDYRIRPREGERLIGEVFIRTRIVSLPYII